MELVLGDLAGETTDEDGGVVGVNELVPSAGVTQEKPRSIIPKVVINIPISRPFDRRVSERVNEAKGPQPWGVIGGGRR